MLPSPPPLRLRQMRAFSFYGSMSKEDILDNKPAFQMRVLENAAFLLCNVHDLEAEAAAAAASFRLPCNDVCSFV